MTPRVCLGVALLAVLCAARAGAQDVPVTGARVTVVDKPMSVVTITLENRNESALVGWLLEGAGILELADGTPSRDPNSRPFAPGERRKLEGTFSDPPPSLRFVMFADGHYEGDDKGVELFLDLRRQRAASLLRICQSASNVSGWRCCVMWLAERRPEGRAYVLLLLFAPSPV